MPDKNRHQRFINTLSEIKADGLYKTERQITTPQAGEISVKIDGEQNDVINLCANNYLGLANDNQIIAAAKAALDSHGAGMASVRFICGTQDIHKQLEAKISNYLQMEDSILFAACFDANGGVFEPLFTKDDAIISDSLNHASLIDGIRLCKAARYRYINNDMQDLEQQLKTADTNGARDKIIVTDGVFSMDGTLANLKQIRQLADKYNAYILVDDCHATGFMGKAGSGTPSHAGVKVDILTGTFGKALGGTMGGYISAAKPIIDLLRQRARPYLFSNSLAPAIVGASLKAIELAQNADDRREALFENAAYFREKMTDAGFDLTKGEHPIIPVMLKDAKLAQHMASLLYENGVYVTAFAFPVVPKGQARIRTQMNATLTKSQLDKAINAFSKAGKQLNII